MHSFPAPSSPGSSCLTAASSFLIEPYPPQYLQTWSWGSCFSKVRESPPRTLALPGLECPGQSIPQEGSSPKETAQSPGWPRCSGGVQPGISGDHEQMPQARLSLFPPNNATLINASSPAPRTRKPLPLSAWALRCPGARRKREEKVGSQGHSAPRRSPGAY